MINTSSLSFSILLNEFIMFSKSKNSSVPTHKSSQLNHAKNISENNLYQLSNSELNKNLKYYYSKMNSSSMGMNKVFDELTQHNLPTQVENKFNFQI